MITPKQHATEIVRTLHARGFQGYFAGGCVRDLLLGREPADYDVATDATPERVMQIFPETYAVGARFGVVLVPAKAETTEVTGGHGGEAFAQGEVGGGQVLPGAADGSSAAARSQQLAPPLNKPIEVATFRADAGYSDGRHPDEVRFTESAREDVERRDFTINGMMLDPLVAGGVSDGVLDFVGGRADLATGIVRAIGDPDRRFSEDKLRMLRAVRFAARFGFTIDPATFAAIELLAPQIRQVSQERAREELTKMLTEGRAQRAFQLLDESGLLAQVLPEISAMKGVEQPPQYHPEGDVFVHTLLLLEKLPAGCSKTLAWGALLHDVGKPPTFRVAPDRIRFDGHVEIGVKMAADICRRLRFSNDDADQILALVDNHMRFGDVMRMKESTLKKFLRLPEFDEHLELHRIDCLSSHGLLDTYNYAREKFHSVPPEEIRPAPLVTGQDLIDAGYEPGPRFKEILEAVEDAQLEGRLTSRDGAMEFVRREFPRLT